MDVNEGVVFCCGSDKLVKKKKKIHHGDVQSEQCVTEEFGIPQGFAATKSKRMGCLYFNSQKIKDRENPQFILHKVTLSLIL